MQEKRNNAVGPQVRNTTKSIDQGVRITFVCAILVMGFIVATQWFAHLFGYQGGLGGSFFHFYWPWKILEWSKLYQDEFPSAVKQAGSIGTLFSAAMMFIGFGLIVMHGNSAKAHPYMHGSARWADKKDIEAAGLLGNAGVYVGAWLHKNRRYYLRHDGPEHVMCFAPTRSGKGVGLVVPTLLSWEHSAVILDLKGELWQMTSGCRKQKLNNKVMRFEPASLTGSVGFNPLEEIRIGTEYEVGDVQNLVTLIVDPDGRGIDAKNHWQTTSYSLLVGAVLHLLYKCKAQGKIANFSLLDRMLADPSQPAEDLWEDMIITRHLKNGPHPVVAASGRDMRDRPPQEAGSVLSTAKSYLSLYRDPVVTKNISKSDFRISDLMNHDNPVSLYIITQPTDKTRLRPLVRIVINMIVRLLADKLDFERGRPKPNYKHRLLMMLDEFPSLGKLEIMQESLAFIATYGIKCYIIAQDISQLKNSDTGYGEQESITTNCHVQVAFPPSRLETAEHLSKLTGVTTVVKEQITTSGNRMSPMLGQVSRSYQEVERYLLTPDECTRMPGPLKENGFIKAPGDMIVCCTGFPAIYGKQPLYFQDTEFQKDSEIPAPKESDKLIPPELLLLPKPKADKSKRKTGKPKMGKSKPKKDDPKPKVAA